MEERRLTRLNMKMEQEPQDTNADILDAGTHQSSNLQERISNAVRLKTMVKPSQRHVDRVSNSKKKTRRVPVGDPDDEDWIEVKKQRVIIVIPSLPSSGKFMSPVAGESQPQETPGKDCIQPPRPSETLPLRELDHEKEKSLSPSPDQPSLIHPSQPTLTSQRPSILTHNSLEEAQHHSLRYGKNLSFCRSPDLSCGFLNRKMKASYLEKKLKRAGGLERWLNSLGLGLFVRIFNRRRVDNFHLANLTMNKLKDMGAEAVGPRRKLLHAMDCLCEPQCFQCA